MKKIILFFTLFTLSLYAGAIRTDKHDFFTKGFRIVVDARISDTAGVYEARVYFKRHNVKHYQVYSVMKCKENRCYAELPRTNDHLRFLDYIVVYQNSAGVVFKSDTHTMEKRDMLELPAWQTLNRKPLTLESEYAKAPTWVNGFRDKFSIKKSVEESKMGVTVGIYPMELIAPSVQVPTCLKCPDCKASVKIGG
jgi:hypothetical protein